VHAIDDEPFDAAAVEAGAWRAPYGPDDTFGAYAEVTPERRGAALAWAAGRGAAARTISLGEPLFAGYPAFGTRSFALQLWGSGFDPPPGVHVERPRPWGPNRLTSLEERVQFSFNMGAKINGLAHCGVGDLLYGGRSLHAEVATGARSLDTTTWGAPLVTRGVLFDVLGWCVATGRADALSAAPGGHPILRDHLRITVEDLEACAAWAGLPPLAPGDAVLVRTGWRRLLRSDPQRYLSGNPGVYLRETRWLAQFRPALVGADTWCFETTDAAVTGRNRMPCHQELLVRFGIRLGESLALDELAGALHAERLPQFVLCHTPLEAEGAVSSSSPALAIV
jgi:hypothetical protein